MAEKFLTRERGQGLVEYALILVLVAVVVIVVLSALGPSVGEIFSSVMTALQWGVAGDDGGSALTSVSVSEGFGTLTVTVQVSQSTTVSLSGDVSHSGQACNGSCQFSFGTYPAHGTVTATAAAGGQRTASW
jgi:pilus assembly protein Flp/PilA